jgi:hypothetical protein
MQSRNDPSLFWAKTRSAAGTAGWLAGETPDTFKKAFHDWLTEIPVLNTHIPHPVFNVSAAPILPSFPIHPGKRYVRRVTHADVGSCWVACPRIASSVILRLN